MYRRLKFLPSRVLLLPFPKLSLRTTT
jgi:hypothetical protein